MKKFMAVALLAAATFVAYAPALRDAFVWDDTALVLRDPLIRSWRLIPEGFNHFLFVDATASDFYRPIQRLVYTGVYQFFAFNPAAYHAVSIFVHALAAIALLFFGEELLRILAFSSRSSWLTAFAAALIWAVHPVQSSAVAYVAGLADPLAAFFGFSALYLFLRASSASRAHLLAWTAAGGVCLLASVLSKEMGFVFVPIALLLLVWQRNRRALAGTVTAVLFVGTIYFTLRHGAEHNPAPPAADAPSWTVRPITMARALAEYTGLVLFPANLHMERHTDAFITGPNDQNIDAAAWRELQTVAGLIILAALVWWAICARRHNQPALLFLLMAAMAYLPVSGIWVLNASVAEHWIYVPTAFLFLAAAVSLCRLAQESERTTWINRFAAVAVVILGLMLGARTFVRTFDWKDQRTFLERTIASGGDSARMLINLAGLELSEDHLDLAKKDLHRALEKETNQPLAIIDLAAVALKENNWKTARELLMRATKMPVVDARAHEMLAVLENKEHGKADLLRLRLAARTGPPDWSIESRYIRLLNETGATSKAIEEIRQCLTTEWYRAETWDLLSELLKKIRDETRAAHALALARDYDVHLDQHPVKEF